VVVLTGLVAVAGLAASLFTVGGPAIAVHNIRAAEQPQLSAVGAAAAWLQTRGRGVTVAVLDTGVDASVPDLAGSVTAGPDETLGADPAGYQPPHLHGTYIASLIAGHGSGAGRRSGVIGIAPAATILSVRVILDDSEPGFGSFANEAASDSAVVSGIRYAVQHGVGVINMSPTENLRTALGYAAARGVVVVAAAGNDGGAQLGYTPFSYPAGFPGVIAVAAVSLNGDRAGFSDDNSSVVLSAPGLNVIGAGPGDSYLEADGTSPASAEVAGVAALIRARYPRLSPVQVEQAMTSSATHRPRGGYSPSTGFGEVDASAALAAARRLAAAPARPGLAAGAQFAHPGPIQVVHRDVAAIIDYALAAAVFILAFLVLTAVLTVRIRRRRRSRGRPAGPGQPGWPGPSGPPWPSEQFAQPQ
jgi:subtilisin family serine protease